MFHFRFHTFGRNFWTVRARIFTFGMWVQNKLPGGDHGGWAGGIFEFGCNRCCFTQHAVTCWTSTDTMQLKETSAQREKMGVWGHSPQWGPGAKTLVMCRQLNMWLIKNATVRSKFWFLFLFLKKQPAVSIFILISIFYLVGLFWAPRSLNPAAGWPPFRQGRYKYQSATPSILATLFLSWPICRLLATLIYGARAMPFGTQAALGARTKKKLVRVWSVN